MTFSGTYMSGTITQETFDDGTPAGFTARYRYHAVCPRAFASDNPQVEFRFFRPNLEGLKSGLLQTDPSLTFGE